MDALQKFVQDFLLEAFKSLPDMLKLVVFVALILIIVLLAIWRFVGWRRIGRLKHDLHEAKEKIKDLEDRWNALDTIDEHIWKRPDAEGENHFSDAEQRKTRFIAVCNLKGGVGKTTVTVNLGASLAKAGKKVLFLDMDYQASLSRFLAKDERYNENRAKKWTTSKLLDPDTDTDHFFECIFEANDVPNASVMIADEKLEFVEWEKQAKFYALGKDPRFYVQRILHTEPVFQAFDYVLFDCPPRMTTAAINAMTCADFVLVPSSLSLADVFAIPRTLKWLEELKTIVAGRFLGVVVSRCKKISGKLVKRDEGYLKQLNNILQQRYKAMPGANFIFSAMIPDSPEIHEYSGLRRPIVLDSKSKDGSAFQNLRQEFEKRI